MNAVPDPRIPLSPSPADATSHDSWFRAKVQEAIDSSKPRIPHNEAVARVDELLDKKRRMRAGSSLD